MAEKSKKHDKIMVFRPTYDEFKDFSKYINYIEKQGAHKIGLAKIIPPAEWVPCKNGYNIDDLDITIPAPIEQEMHVLEGRTGVYTVTNWQKPRMTIQNFKKSANSKRYSPPETSNIDDLEKHYWKTMMYQPPIYAADVPGSLTDKTVKEWNISCLDSILNDYHVTMDGVNSAYLYLGMWKSSFSWHTEDMELYSINYLHFGAPKFWYSIPPSSGHKFERLAARLYTDKSNECSAFLRHKTSMISPKILEKNSIPFNKIVQKSGEIMITFPFSYHAGFNLGFNCAESTNFAQERWIEYGKHAKLCYCSETVNISMDTFVKRYQPQRYKLWLDGRDDTPHPEDERYQKNNVDNDYSDESEDDEWTDSSDESNDPENSENGCDKFKNCKSVIEIIDLLNSTGCSEDDDHDDRVKKPKNSSVLFDFEDSGVAMSEEDEKEKENVELSDDEDDDFGPLRYEPEVFDDVDKSIKKQNAKAMKILFNNSNLTVKRISVDRENKLNKGMPVDDNSLIEIISIDDDNDDLTNKMSIDGDNLTKIISIDDDNDDLTNKMSTDDNNLTVDSGIIDLSNDIDEPGDEIPIIEMDISSDDDDDDDGVDKNNPMPLTLMTPPQSPTEHPGKDESTLNSRIPGQFSTTPWPAEGRPVECLGTDISNLEKNNHQSSFYRENNGKSSDKVPRPTCPVSNTLEMIQSDDGDEDSEVELMRDLRTEEGSLSFNSVEPTRLCPDWRQDCSSQLDSENVKEDIQSDIQIILENGPFQKTTGVRTYPGFPFNKRIYQSPIPSDETPVERLKRYVSIAGINLTAGIIETCQTDEDRMLKLRALLRKSGVTGEITSEKCRAAARRRIRDAANTETEVGENNTVCIDLCDDSE